MRSRSARRPGRNLFLLFILSAFGAIFLAAPLVSALDASRGFSVAQAGRAPAAAASASGGSSSAALQVRHPTFEQCDRNKDGMLDKSEAAAVQGLSANFERADANRDGRLDKVEYAKALSQLDARR